ncbi:MAG: hypothetical protein GX682_02050 [Clostridiaceae bacterium]|nr:hypothetical protein [Clostridiaceae bacterium]
MQGNIPMANDQIEEIKEILKEVKNEQQNLSNQTQKNFEIIVRKLMKMQEYNEISDMTNQVFEMRLSNIEDFLFQLDKYIYNKKNRKEKQK